MLPKFGIRVRNQRPCPHVGVRCRGVAGAERLSMSLSKPGLASTLKRKLDAEVPSRLSAVSRVLVSVADKALFAQSPSQIRITADNSRSRIKLLLQDVVFHKSGGYETPLRRVDTGLSIVTTSSSGCRTRLPWIAAPYSMLRTL